MRLVYPAVSKYSLTNLLILPIKPLIHAYENNLPNRKTQIKNFDRHFKADLSWILSRSNVRSLGSKMNGRLVEAQDQWTDSCWVVKP